MIGISIENLLFVKDFLEFYRNWAVLWAASMRYLLLPRRFSFSASTFSCRRLCSWLFYSLWFGDIFCFTQRWGLRFILTIFNRRISKFRLVLLRKLLFLKGKGRFYSTFCIYKDFTASYVYWRGAHSSTFRFGQFLPICWLPALFLLFARNLRSTESILLPTCFHRGSGSPRYLIGLALWIRCAHCWYYAGAVPSLFPLGGVTVAEFYTISPNRPSVVTRRFALLFSLRRFRCLASDELDAIPPIFHVW